MNFLSVRLKRVLRENIDLIDNQEFDTLAYRLFEEEIPSEVIAEMYQVFRDKNIDIFSDPDMTYIPNYWAKNSLDNSFDIPKGKIDEIFSHAFNNCINLEVFVVPDGVNYIDSFCFYDCTNLRSITLPRTISEIRYMTFGNCHRLETMNYKGTFSEFQQIKFDQDWISMKTDCILICGDGYNIPLKEYFKEELPNI